jgi:hypothetical protein
MNEAKNLITAKKNPAIPIKHQATPAEFVNASCSKVPSRIGNPASSGIPMIDNNDKVKAIEAKGNFLTRPFIPSNVGLNP